MGLDVENFEISVGGKHIVNDISLRVLSREFVGLLGPNGCGKSTLLRAIYKAIKPESGAAKFDEMDILRANNKEVAQQIGVVSQFNELSFDFSVRQLVLMGRTPHKGFMEQDTANDVALADMAIEAVGLDGFADRSYITLSGGEKQRAVLARVITQEPRFLILDEPTNHLDIKFQLKIMSTVRSLGIGILAAMHDLTLAANYCDYIYLLKNGRVVAEGCPEQVLTEQNIYDVYEVKCYVEPSPITGRVAVTYIT